jgi:chorismate mutase
MTIVTNIIYQWFGLRKKRFPACLLPLIFDEMKVRGGFVKNPIQSYRNRIDRIDRRMVRLLQKRYELVREVGREKGNRGLSIVQPERERQVLEQVTSKIEAGQTRDYIRAVYRALFKASYDVENGQ